MDEAHRREALLKEYGEVANNFRLLTDIRFKLLALLPIATVATLALQGSDAGGDAKKAWLTLGLAAFGLLVTVALVTYSTRNDQLYDVLVARAAAIERSVGLPDGAFAHRPVAWLSIGPWKVSHRRPVALIYGASAALWLFMGLDSAVQLGCGKASASGRLAALLGAAAVVWAAAKYINHSRARREQEVRRHVSKAVNHAERPGGLRAAATSKVFRERCARVSHTGDVELAKRANFYANLELDDPRRHYYGLDVSEAVYFVALMTDLSPLWIEDVTSGRR